MALSIIAQPNTIHPAYNPVVWVFNSTESSTLGFRYLINLYKYTETSPEPIGQFRIAPDPNGNGQSNISKILQSNINSSLNFEATSPTTIDYLSMCTYYIECLEEFTYNENFTDYEFGGYWVRLPIASTGYNVGDLVYIQLDDQTITDNRVQLNGYHTVVTVDSTYIEIDVLFSTIGSGPLTPGKVYYADRRKVIGDSLTEYDYVAYNQAVPFVDFPYWNETKVLCNDNFEPEGYILTNSPNFYETYKEKDKYIIKPYQALFWNVFDKAPGNLSTQANTIIATNNFGDRWMMTNFDNTLVTMRQFDLGLDNGKWINITPNWDNTGGFIYGDNPYTHINPDGSKELATFVQFDTANKPGARSDDEIRLNWGIDQPVGGYEAYDFTFKPTGLGLNGRRLYKGFIDGFECYIYYAFSNTWRLSVGLASSYSSVPIMTNNDSPLGRAIAGENNADAWKAFTRDRTVYWESNTTPSGTNNIPLTYRFNGNFSGAFRNARVQRYSFFIDDTIGRPKDWDFQGSNDNGFTWTTLHSVTNYSDAGEYNSPGFSNDSYSSFRLLFTRGQDAADRVRVSDFQIIANSIKATLGSGGNAPTSGGFLIWTINETSLPHNVTSQTIFTVATGDEPTFPTLRPRQVFLDHNCEINSTQLLFLDRSGSYSSFVFPLRKIENGTSTKLSYKNEIGSVNDGEWTYNTYDSESTVYNSSVEKTYTLTTDWLTTGMSDYFEELITSPEVYIKLNSEQTDGRDGESITPWIACTVLDSNFVNPKQKNKRLINRTITVKLNSNNAINI